MATVHTEASLVLIKPKNSRVITTTYGTSLPVPAEIAIDDLSALVPFSPAHKMPRNLFFSLALR
jgi:hypothetical protein